MAKQNRRTVFDLKRGPYAILVIAFSSYLAVILGSDLVWTNFYLLSGKLLRVRTAAWIFAAWSVPLVLFNAFFTKRHRELHFAVILGFAPVSLRQISLLRNYSVALMLICFGVIAALAIGAYLYFRLRCGRSVAVALEEARICCAVVLIFVFSLTFFVDLLIPTMASKQIDPVSAPAADGTAGRRVSDADLATLNSTAWDALSADEKARITLSVLEEMSDEMGIETPSIYLETDAYVNDIAFYSDLRNAIFFWKPYIEQESAVSVVYVALHELFHAYQFSVIHSPALNWDSPDIEKNAYFATVLQWKTESELYVASDRWDETFDAYYGQKLESDARDFAQTFLARFFDEELLTESLRAASD